MANSKQALKRARQEEKRRQRNKRVLTTFRNMVKNVRKAIEAEDSAAAQAALPSAVKALNRAASKGVIHVNQAARKIGRLTRAVSALKPLGA